MNISFDLDSTLIPNGKEFETEKRTFMAKVFRVEKLRKGTKELFSSLEKEGHNLNIYTTSFRSKSRIRFMFWCYSIRVGKIVNQIENHQKLKSINISSSKYPTVFGFDLHIDDSKGVEIEGNKHNFKVL